MYALVKILLIANIHVDTLKIGVNRLTQHRFIINIQFLVEKVTCAVKFNMPINWYGIKKANLSFNLEH